MQFNLTAPCLFGLEGTISNELKRLEMKNVLAENGRVNFSGSAEDIAKANLSLRCAERVMIKCGEFRAATFDELFDGVQSIDWASYLPRDAAFPVKGSSIGSALTSIPACQSIIKKAIVASMTSAYKTDWFKESGETYQIRFSIMKDVAAIYLDTSGPGLHKRGYRPRSNAAPLRETLAAGMVIMSRYRGRDDFYDPFCGSGTIPIEAALIAKNRAPGLNRSFASERWHFAPPQLWKRAREEAVSREYSGDYRIFGSDIDPECAALSESCAKSAGVSDCVRFETADAGKLVLPGSGSGCVIVTNPPYGERMLEKRAAEGIYRGFGAVMSAYPDASLYLLSSNPEFERLFGRFSEKKRKLYNGMIKCELFIFFRKG